MEYYLTTQNKIVLDFTLKEGETPIILRLQRPNTIDLSYRLSRSMPLEFVLRDYCEKMCLLYSNTYFIYDGSKLCGDQTADQLEMESENVIYVMKAIDWGEESSIPGELPKLMYIDLSQDFPDADDDPPVTTIENSSQDPLLQAFATIHSSINDMKREKLAHYKSLEAALKKVDFFQAEKNKAEAKVSSLEAQLAISQKTSLTSEIKIQKALTAFESIENELLFSRKATLKAQKAIALAYNAINASQKAVESAEAKRENLKMELGQGNVGLIFTKGDLKDVRVEVAEYNVGAPDVSDLTLAEAPHMLINGFKNLLAVAVASKYSFPEADKVKECLKDPGEFAVSAAAPVVSGGAATSVEAESEDEDMFFSLFD